VRAVWDPPATTASAPEPPPSMIERLAQAVAHTAGGAVEPADRDDAMPQPDPDATTYVVIHKHDREAQQYGKTYTFGSRAGGSSKQLADDLDQLATGGKPVQFIIYRPDPYYAFTAWATVVNVQTHQAADGEQVWQADLQQYEFPHPVPAKDLANEIGWLSRGLAIAFRGISIRKISPEEVATIMAAGQRVPPPQAVAHTAGGGEDETGEVTGTAAGLSGEDQIRIALQEIEQHDGTATIQQIYNAISRHIGKPLSEQGRASLRFFINKVAVERGYVYPHDPEHPGWRITPEGREWLVSYLGNTATAGAKLSMADAAYEVLRKIGGGPLHLPDILAQALAQGLIAPSGATPQLSLSTALRRDNRFTNLGENRWVLAPFVDPGKEPDDALNDPYTPRIYAAENASFWRIHFPSEHWAEAHARGIIAINLSNSEEGPNAKRFNQIKPGDRIVAYVQKGRIGGIGIVTRAAYDVASSPLQTKSAASFDAAYPHRLDVAWSDELSEPVDLLPRLKQHETLYSHLRYTQTVKPLPLEEYTTLLSLLAVDDPAAPIIAPPHLLPLPLSAYADFAQQLEEHQAYTADDLHALAVQTMLDFDADSDADSFVTLLQQLRLLTSEVGAGYRLQAYVRGEPTALLRLMALAYLHPSSPAATTYDLPACTLIPHLRASTDRPDRASSTPALGPAAQHLRAWYAEAGLIAVDGTHWQLTHDALTPLAGSDPTTVLYNQFLRALLAAQDHAPADLAPVPIDAPLPAISALAQRLRELDADLIVDEQIVKRICRSLLAGRHVVLSGPPGTGKTELARRLPALLWREEPQSFTRLSTSLNAPPVQEVTEQRHGYAVELVTATEDWGVRDVVGGIGPRLDGDGSSATLRYVIEHGHLTRTVLRHFAGTEHGRRLPTSAAPQRHDYRDPSHQRYRGIWLVIDEFTRAPIDAAFGSLLTTLSGGEHALLAVPTANGIEQPIPLPRDFRIIGTLNSFDRHFLNEMSEALKRRFDFIDVLPPHPRDEPYEQGIAIKQALRRLAASGLAPISSTGEPAAYTWPGILTVRPGDVQGRIRYTWHSDNAELHATLASFWQIFRAIRIFRQLGTAQAVAVYINLFTGYVLGMTWAEALDTALADALADQLQVLTRDEQRTLDAYVEHAAHADQFSAAITAIFAELPSGRRVTFLYALRAADQQRNGSSDIEVNSSTAPEPAQLARVFALGEPLQLPPAGAFLSRLRDLIGERGL
ncbi:MAG: AAA domain-containing protein, partial [Chloroflexaceae bacterium]|nr:AAA domain-containing protein [Chloroflexaceae bacterium]